MYRSMSKIPLPLGCFFALVAIVFIGAAVALKEGKSVGLALTTATGAAAGRNTNGAGAAMVFE